MRTKVYMYTYVVVLVYRDRVFMYTCTHGLRRSHFPCAHTEVFMLFKCTRTEFYVHTDIYIQYLNIFIRIFMFVHTHYIYIYIYMCMCVSVCEKYIYI